MSAPRKTVYIKTYGCQMNAYDSDRMADILSPLGYARAVTPDEADLAILNTCHIREKAAEKVYSELGRLKKLKDARDAASAKGGMMLAVAGCVAQAEGEEILRRAPYVDLIFGPQTYHRLPEMIAMAHRAAPRRELDGAGSPRPGVGIVDTDFPSVSKFDNLPAPTGGDVSAFLSIQEGCDKFCTFCVVPYTRGAEFSRSATEILREARLLVDRGAREITLLGQNVNAYHGAAPARSKAASDWGLGRLIRELANIDGLDRIRYTTSHPRDMDGELIAAHRDVPQLMPFLHLPAQSGSDRVLSAMNRRHGAGLYRDVVRRLRDARPDIALSSDFIVGFPGETNRDFDRTMALIDEIGFAQAFSFKYSPRPGTPAASAAQVPEGVKSARLNALQALLKAQQLAFNRSLVGSVQPVLMEKPGREPGQIVGRSPFMQWVHVFDTEETGRRHPGANGSGIAVGDLVEVMIGRCGPNSLAGAPLRDGGPIRVGHDRIERTCV